ncbi:carbonic anhydrase, partial [Punctularia strigosozonata HHB-11173 SS5]|uniref:carbonic anhydrase n=1 Tax=Punctularia strigosozonata (strain HHB-11173) TaxID=741275 RepID=UPI0004417E5B
LLSRNAEWAATKDPTFLVDSSDRDQRPRVMWIGCSDSRVPESVVTRSRPGDIFVHRNVAKLFNPDEDSVMTAVTFAIEDIGLNNVGVEHIVVVGHTNCGAASYASDAAENPSAVDRRRPMYRWLQPLIRLAGTVTGKRTQNLIIANIQEQVDKLAQSEPVIRAWDNPNRPALQIHGWLYELSTGLLRDLEIT